MENRIIKYLVSLLMAGSLVISAYGQLPYNKRPEFLNANSVWIFGQNAGLKFEQGKAVQPFTIAPSFYINIDEGSTSLASPGNGNLLCFAGGRRCYNRNGAIMLNGQGVGLDTPGSSTQGNVFVPIIDSPTRYYLFSLNYQYGKPGLCYSVVDTTLSGGLGNVVPGRKNIILDTGSLSEAMIAIPGNNCDIWVLTHVAKLPIFKAYHITKFGVDPNPVISTTGQQIQGDSAYYLGGMVVSSDRTRLVINSIARLNPATILNKKMGFPYGGSLLCKFDAATGVVSDAITVEDSADCYSASFSPDNSKLYVSEQQSALTGAWFIQQYDVSAYNTVSIKNSRTFIQSVSAFTSLKLYNDTIYSPEYLLSYLDRINNPNAVGTACNFQLFAITLAPGSSSEISLPTEVVFPYSPDTLTAVETNTAFCFNTLHAPTGYSGYLWNDSTTDTVNVVTQLGKYWVLCQDECHSLIDTFDVEAINDTITRSSAMCMHEHDTILHAPQGYMAYHWDDGSAIDTRGISGAGKYWVYYKDSCHDYTDTFIVNQYDLDFDLGNDMVVCNDTAIVHLQVTAQADRYVWQDGSIASTYTVTKTGSYWATVYKNSCMAADTINIRYVNLKENLGSDVVACNDVLIDIVLQASVPGAATALWSDGSTGNTLQVHDTGTYWLTVIEPPCAASDTVVVSTEVCHCHISIPSVFSPNSDGKNDVFRTLIPEGCIVNNYQLSVYDRWGQKVFTATQPSQGWDGTYNGASLEIGTYLYILEYEGGTSEQHFFLHGDIILVR